MSETAQHITPPPAAGLTPRRALVIAEAAAYPRPDESLGAAGYEVLRATTEDGARLAADAEPDVVLIILGEADDAQADTLALARRLRADARTFALPLVLLYQRDADELRLAALGVGADDYFALATTPAEIRARLDSLLWRAEAGRLAALPPEEESDAQAAEEEAPARGADAHGGADAGHDADTDDDTGDDPSRDVRHDVSLGVAAERVDEEGAAARAGEEVSPDLPPPPSEHEHAVTRSPSSAVPRESHGSGHVPAEDGDALGPAADAGPRARRTPAATPASREARMIEALGAATESLARTGRGIAAPRGPAGAGSRVGRGGPRRLLLAVSDAARMAQLNLLIRSANYEVRAAFDGQQALSLLRIERPDLVLVDFELHDMDGVEMLRRLREQQGGRRAAPPAVLLLDARHEQARREASEIGARAVVTLPYNPDELLESIHAAGSAD